MSSWLTDTVSNSGLRVGLFSFVGAVGGVVPAAGPPGVRELSADLVCFRVAQQVKDVGGVPPRGSGGIDIASRIVRVTK